MRILMVAHAFPRTEADPAGAFIWRLAEALADRGHELSAIAPADRGEVGAATLGRVAVRRVRYAAPHRETLAYRGTMHRAVARSPRAAIAFARLVSSLARATGVACRSGAADLVHAHWWVPAGVSAVFARRAGRPVVITLHGTDVALARRFAGLRWAMGAVLGRAAAVTAVSTPLAREASRAAGRPESDIAVTPMPLAESHLAPNLRGGTGLAPPAFEPPRAEGGDRGGGARAGAVFVGRLVAQKGVADLLAALAELRRRGSAIPLTVVGDGPERQALERRAVLLGLGKSVRFVGAVSPERVSGLLADKRVAVLPATGEGLGLVVAEALAAGVPVVAYDSGGIADLLVDREAGVLVRPGDVTGLADAMHRVVSDQRYLDAAVRAGRVLAARLAPSRVAEQFESVYQSACARVTE